MFVGSAGFTRLERQVHMQRRPPHHLAAIKGGAGGFLLRLYEMVG